jgi:hypothetical protein
VMGVYCSNLYLQLSVQNSLIFSFRFLGEGEEVLLIRFDTKVSLLIGHGESHDQADAE